MSLGTIALSPNDSFRRPGSFLDPGTDTWTATVDYGDGDGPQALGLTDKSFSLSHVYTTAGNWTVQVTINDGDGGVTTKSFQVLVGSTVECLIPQIP